MREEEDTVNPTHLLMIDYVARLEKKVSELKKENEELVGKLGLISLIINLEESK